MRGWIRFACVVALLVATNLPAAAADVTVFAAASLGDALQEAGTAYQKQTGHSAVFSFAASSTLAHQIENASGADVFISADEDWMDYLDRKGLIARASRIDLVGNHLVLIASRNATAAIAIRPHFDLAGALGGGRLAVADTASVPAGKYAKASLLALGVWDSVANRLAAGENVRAALAFVAEGEAPLGIVYTTDAFAEPGVRIVATFPESTHPPIRYPAALTRDAKPLAREFLAYLRGPAARAIFRKNGFVILGTHP